MSAAVTAHHQNPMPWLPIMKLPPRAANLPKFVILPLSARRDGAATSEPAPQEQLILCAFHPSTHVYICMPIPTPPTMDPEKPISMEQLEVPIIVDQGVLQLPNGSGRIHDVLGFVSSNPQTSGTGPRLSQLRESAVLVSARSSRTAASGASSSTPHAQAVATTSSTTAAAAAVSHTLTHVAVVCQSQLVVFEASSFVRAVHTRTKATTAPRGTPALQLLRPLGSVPAKQTRLNTVADIENHVRSCGYVSLCVACACSSLTCTLSIYRNTATVFAEHVLIGERSNCFWQSRGDPN